MEHNLLPPIMMRVNGLLVDECPKFLYPNHTIETHSIFFPTENNQLTLALHGTTSYISTRRTKGMSEVNEHIKIVLTSENPDWDPSSPIYAQQESEMKNWKGEIRTIKTPNREVLIVKVPLHPRPKKNTPTPKQECMNDCPKTTTPTPKAHASINACTSSLLEQINITSISSTRRNIIYTEAFVEKWDVRLTTAKRTTKVTTP